MNYYSKVFIVLAHKAEILFGCLMRRKKGLLPMTSQKDEAKLNKLDHFTVRKKIARWYETHYLKETVNKIHS
jgi:hypothetical protein